MISPLLLVILACCISNFFSLKIHHSTTIIKRSVQLTRTSILFANDNNKENEPGYDASYYKGLITDPINSEISDGKDNLSPNIKFIGIFGVIIAGLLGAFIFSNIDTPPPPF